MQIQDAAGSGKGLRINGRNEATVFAVVESEIEAATDLGQAFNLSSGEITGLTTGDASLIYFKNDEDQTYVIDALVVGLRGFTGLTDMATITVYREPSGGDLITEAVVADIESNTNFGSSNTLGVGTLLYKGKAAGTVTGDTHAIIYGGNNSRVFVALPIELPRGGSIAVSISSDATAGSAYCALVGHLKDSLRDGDA